MRNSVRRQKWQFHAAGEINQGLIACFLITSQIVREIENTGRLSLVSARQSVLTFHLAITAGRNNCANGVVNDVFNNGRKIFEVGVPPTQVPTMPIEFSVACFRLGHSMIRPAYNWNKVFAKEVAARRRRALA